MSEELDFSYVLEAFQFIEDWETRYQFIEDLGRKLPPMSDDYKTSEYRIHPCMSMVWIRALPSTDKNGAVVFEGDSDTGTIKGIVAILISIYRDKTAAEILEIDADEKFAELKLFDHLSPTRHVGVYALVEHARDQARKLLP
jgi:cysteine desulfuration protein SufE